MARGRSGKALRRRSKVLEERGDLKGAVALLHEALAADRERLGEGHPDVRKDMNNLAMLLVELGSLDEAEALYDEAIRLGGPAAGEGAGADPNLGVFYSNLSFLLMQRKDWERAIWNARKALEVDVALCGADSATLASHQKGLGLVLGEAGRQREALEALERAADMFRSGEARDVGQLVQCLSFVATAHHSFGELEAADRAATESVALQEPDGRVSGVRFRTHLSNLANVKESRGELAAAAHYFWRAISVDASRGEEGTADSLTDQIMYGRVLRLMGRLDDAEAVLRAVLARAGGRAGMEMEHARTLYDLGEVALARGRLDEARDLFARALERRREGGDTVYEWMAWAFEGLSALKERQGDIKGAVKMLFKARWVYTACKGKGHPDVAHISDRLKLLGDIKAEMERVAEVEAVGKRCGPSSPEAIDARADLARHVFDKGRRAEGIGLYASVVAAEREARGDASPRLPALLERLSGLHREGGDGDAAARVFDEAVAATVIVHGEVSEQHAAILATKARMLRTAYDHTSCAAVVRSIMAIHRRMFGEADDRYRSDVVDLHEQLLAMPEALVDRGELERVSVLAERIKSERSQTRHPGQGVDLESMLLIRDGHEDCVAFLEKLYERAAWFGDGTPAGIERNRAIAGAILRFRGDSADHLLYAETLLRRGLEGQRALPARVPAQEATLLADLGRVLCALGSERAAGVLLERASGAVRASGSVDARISLDALVAVGDLGRRLGLAEGARRAYEEALAVARGEPLVGVPFVGRICHRLSETALMSGDREAAMGYADLALEADLRAFGERSPFVRSDREQKERLGASGT